MTRLRRLGQFGKLGKLGRWFILGTIVIGAIVMTRIEPVASQGTGEMTSPTAPAPTTPAPIVPASIRDQLPPPQVHPMPSPLAERCRRLTLAASNPPIEPTSRGDAAQAQPTIEPTTHPRVDYFDRIEPSPLGPLVWSHWPIAIAIEPADGSPAAIAWERAVRGAIGEWSADLPLRILENPANSGSAIDSGRADRQAQTPAELQPDIQFRRSTPTLDLRGSSPRASNARTHYEFYRRVLPGRELGREGTSAVPVPGGDGRSIAFDFRMVIEMRAGRSDRQLLATARHELGHALGLWGHSPVASDALFDRPVANPPGISDRDQRTLCRVYEQATALGWPIVP